MGSIKLAQPSLGLSITLHDVRFCPNSVTNIISVDTLEADGFILDWQTRPSPVRVLEKGKLVAQFHRVNQGFYSKFRLQSSTSLVNSVGKTPSPELWHKRMAHINHRYVKNSANYDGPSPHEICETCVKAKQTCTPGKENSPPAAKPFDRIFVDLDGGLDALPEGISISRTKARHFILFTDDATRYRWVYPLEKKPDTTQLLLDFLALIKTQFQATPKAIRSDGGREFNNDNVAKALRERSTLWEPTAAKAPEQNGVSERSMRTLMQTTRAMLLDSGVPRRYWPYALETAVYIWNRTLNQKKSPYEQLMGKSPDISHLKVFGCVAHVHDPNHKSKLDPRSNVMCFLGYGSSRVFLLLDPRTRQVVRRRDVVFDELKTLDWSTYEKASKDQLVNYQTTVSAIHTDTAVAPPSSFREASNCPASPEWHDAMRQEVDQLNASNTWTLVPRSNVPKEARFGPASGSTVAKITGPTKQDGGPWIQ